MLKFALVFAIVFLLNLIPAFAPPTWMAMSYIGIKHPAMNPFLLALTGATAAILGRLTLAKLSRVLIRRNILSEASRKNIDSIRAVIERRRKLTFGLFLFYAFSPLPSNNLFIAYGLTTLPLRLIALPFFAGRFVSYALWFTGASAAARAWDLESFEYGSYLGVYFVVTQIVLLSLVYVFVRVDWQALLSQKKLRWTRRDSPETTRPPDS
jgi:membrane protein DedA with SNARE-associated domain